MDEAAALERLRTILDAPEFQIAAQRSLAQRLWQAVVDLFYTLLMRLRLPGPGSATAGSTDWLRLALWALAAAAIVGAVLYLTQAVRLNVFADARLRQHASQLRQRSDALWRQALSLAEGGDYAGAIVPLYLSALYALDEHGALRVQEGLTNREHARRVAQARLPLGGPFADLVERYDRLRYGSHPVDAATFRELGALVEYIRTAPVSPSGHAASPDAATRAADR